MKPFPESLEPVVSRNKDLLLQLEASIDRLRREADVFERLVTSGAPKPDSDVPQQRAPVHPMADCSWKGRLTGDTNAILLVDDEPDFREICRVFLENDGFSVISAANGSDALTAFLGERERIQAVVTDAVMPVMNGFELMRELTILAPGLPVVGTVGLTELEGVFRTLGASDVLVKPFTGSRLVSAIKSLISIQANDTVNKSIHRN